MSRDARSGGRSDKRPRDRRNHGRDERVDAHRVDAQPDDGLARFRMLNACAVCARQYDVSHLEAGTSVRCECGVTFDVEYRQPKSPRALQCSQCGGALKAKAKSCEFCSAEITLEERRLSAICPSCFSRTSTEARFCMSCGIEIALQTLSALPVDSACPRCEAGLRNRSLGTTSVVECSACGGLWLTEGDFEAVCERADAQELASRALKSTPPPRAPLPEETPRYLPCVTCGELMSRRNYAATSGVIIDVCRRHGVWLDHAELEKVLEFIRAGGLDRARERQMERLREQERKARVERMPSFDGPSPYDLHRSRSLHAPGVDLLAWILSRVGALFSR